MDKKIMCGLVTVGLLLAASLALFMPAEKASADTVILPTYSISGRVINQVDQTGVPGATVSNGYISAMTDANGNYVISGVPAGTYGMTVSKAGWTFIGFMVCVDVPPDAIYNMSGRPTSYSISGKVINQANGTGVAGVKVSNGSRSALTNAYGNYVITDVPAGTYAMTASKDGWTIISLSVMINVPPDAVFNFTGKTIWIGPTATIGTSVDKGSSFRQRESRWRTSFASKLKRFGR